MIVSPMALILGAALARITRRYPRIVALIAWSAHVLAIAAFAKQFLPGGAESCSESN